MTVRVIGGDCIAEMAALASKGILVDAIVTDPPYHLTSGNLSVDWGAFQSEKGETNKAGRKAGFMGQTWDGGDIAFRPETWAAIGAALKPGGYLLAFGGTRTHHRIWCAIEDAGFVIQDTIMWMYGQGFPKGRTQLKPAFEPICVAYKPGGKRALQIDECRVPTADSLGGGGEKGVSLAGKHEGWARPWMSDADAVASFASKVRTNVKHAEALGRWPANLCHDGSDEVMEAFAAFGAKTSGILKAGTERSARSVCYGQMPKVAALQDFGGDTGTAARFFYAAKASKADRAGSKHPTVKPVALMRWLVRLVTPPGGTVLDPFAGSGTTGAAALAEGRNAILIEREPEYIADIRRRMNSSRRAVARAADEATAAQHAA